MFGEERFGSCTDSGLVRQALFALLAFVQRVDLGDGARDTPPQTLFLAGSERQRTHNQSALLPVLLLPGLILTALRHSVFKADRHRIGSVGGVLVSVCQSHLSERLQACKDRLQHQVEFRLRYLFGRERTQVEIPVRDDLGSRPHRRHFAIADVAQSSDLDDLADFGDLRQIERIVRRVASHDRRRQRQSKRIEHRQSDLQLRQIGPMILAVSKLEHPFGRDEGRHCCTVHARHALLQVVDANHALIERALKLYPVLRYAHVIEPRRQPIIGAIARLDLFA